MIKRQRASDGREDGHVRAGKSPGYWRNLVLFALCVVLLGVIAAVLWLAHWRAMALVHPGRSRPSHTPADYGLRDWEEVGFPSADGLQLAGWFIPPDPEGDGATLIYVHGLGSNREELLRQAVMLWRHGYGALLLDLRGHGQSGGTGTTLGYAEVEDVRGAVAYLQTRTEVNPDRIGVVGRSMGGAIALRATARIDHIRAVVAQCAYASIEGQVREGFRASTGLPSFPFAPLVVWFGQREVGLDLGQVRPIDDVAGIAPRAILFIHGEDDPLVDVNNSLRLYEAAREPKELYLIPGAKHGGFLTVEGEELERRMVRFLDAHLRVD